MGERPSVVLGLRQWIQNNYQWDDNWAVIQFDMAVNYLGTLIENKLQETDNKGKRKYNLETLLYDASEPTRKIPLKRQLRASSNQLKGLIGSYVSKHVSK